MIYGEVMDIFCNNTFHLYVMVHLFTWFKFYFPLLQTDYHTSQRERKILNKFNTLLPSSLLYEVDARITLQGTLGIHNFSIKDMPLFL